MKNKVYETITKEKNIREEIHMNRCNEKEKTKGFKQKTSGQGKIKEGDELI